MSFAKRRIARWLLTCLLATLTAPGSGIEQDRSLARTDRSKDSLPRFLRRPSIARNPNPRVPLAAIVEFTTDRPVRVNLDVSDGSNSRLLSYDNAPKKRYRLPLLGLSPGKKYSIAVTVADTIGNEFTFPEPLEIETDPLPSYFPPLRIKISEPDGMEPGVTLFNLSQYGSPSYGLIVAVDQTGEVVWYFRADDAVGCVTQLGNGNLLYLYGSGAKEIDWLGNLVRQWHSTGRESPAREESVTMDIDMFHHDICELPNGNILTLSTELRRLNDYPSSETDESASPETADVVGDLVVEFTPDGRIVNQWSLLDLLDPYRIGYGSLGGLWNALYGSPPNGTRDWTHANAVFYDRSDDSLLVSLRHQDALIKMGRRTGELEWILGNHGGWNPPWNRYLLTPEGELQWPYHQHASIITPEGTILLFDNGNFRARPYEEKMSTAESYSRVVEYKVDTANKTVSQV